MTGPDMPMAQSREEEEGLDGDLAAVLGQVADFALFSAVGETGAALPFTPSIPPNGRPLTSKRRLNGWRAGSTRSGSALKIWKRKKNRKRGE